MKINSFKEEEVEVRYSNWVSMFIDMVKPKNLYVVAGRGTAKSEDILAKRIIDICESMPQSTLSIVSDTYVNAMTNIIPAITAGFERQGYHEGIHWVSDKEPPKHFKRPFYRTTEYKHTITTYLGNKILIKSLDRPSANAGISTVHQFGDEAKFLKLEKLKKSLPANRGDSSLYAKSPYFMGFTWVTDMPNPNNNEHAWILDQFDNMDNQQIYAIFQTALVVNDIEFELYQAKKDNKNKREIQLIERKLTIWKERFNQIRKNSTLALIVSSLANIDILTFDYLITQFETLEYEEFKTAILSIKASLSMTLRFYANLNDANFYYDGYNYDYYDQFNLKDNIKQTVSGLKYVKNELPIEAGFDAGNMMSLVLAQDQGDVYRIFKDMYVLTPEWIDDLAKQFVDYFKPHKRKELMLYYDRSANNYRKQKQDFATKLKQAIEKDNEGKSTGWSVRLMSIGQGNILHTIEYNFMIYFLKGNHRRLPKLLIDAYECKHYKSSLELAPAEKVSEKTEKIRKVKKSEKLPVKRLPFESTNMSDAGKYLLCRKQWLNIVDNSVDQSFGNVDLV